MPTGEFDVQVREMISSLIAKRDQAVKAFDDAIRALETVARTIPPSIAATEVVHPKTESTAARTRRIITLIMKEAGQPMSISKIAERAQAGGLLSAKRGYKGVYADVARVLIRNQHLFAKTGERGFWKLKEIVPAAMKPIVADEETLRGLGVLTGPPRSPSGPPKPYPLDRAAVAHGIK